MALLTNKTGIHPFHIYVIFLRGLEKIQIILWRIISRAKLQRKKLSTDLKQLFFY